MKTTIKKVTQSVRQCEWHNTVASTVLANGGTAEDVQFMVSLARNVAPKKLPQNRQRAAAELWHRQCALSHRS